MDTSVEQFAIRETIATLRDIHTTATTAVSSLEHSAPVPVSIRNTIIQNHNRLRATYKCLRKPNATIASFIRVAKAATKVILHTLRTNPSAAKIAINQFDRCRHFSPSVSRILISSKIPLATTATKAGILVHAIDYHDALSDINSARVAIVLQTAANTRPPRPLRTRRRPRTTPSNQQ